MAAKREPKPRSNMVVQPHPFVADLSGPRDYKGRALECRDCPFPRWNGVHTSSEDFPPVPADDVSDRITGEHE